MTTTTASDEKVRAFRSLHESGCFILPNPWDAGSAVALSRMGFKALATSSAGLAFTLGKPDSAAVLSRDETLANIADIVSASELPVNADFQAGYGKTPDKVAESVRLCVETGVAGLSIEDATGDDASPLYSFDVALDRIRAARAAIDASSRPGVVLTARCEAFLVGADDPMSFVMERLPAFSEAGADCLYAPGLSTREQVEAVVQAAHPKPVNVLASLSEPRWMTLESLGELGVRRISMGSALARTAWTGFLNAAREIRASEEFEALAGGTSFDELNEMFAARV